MNDNLDFNVQIDDAQPGDKQHLLTPPQSYINEPTVKTNSNSNDNPEKKSNSQTVLDFFNNASKTPQQRQQRDNDALPVGTSAYDLSKSGHPIACIFTFAFKVLAFIAYFLFSMKFTSTVFIFVMVITFDALDFWTVKNITGRLLVGMRWWSSQNAAGGEEYHFETYGPSYKPNQVDYAFFWSSQLIFFIFWCLIALVHALTPFWLFLDLITVGMLFTNLYGFYKCKTEYQQTVKTVQDNLKLKGINFLGSYLLGK